MQPEAQTHVQLLLLPGPLPAGPGAADLRLCWPQQQWSCLNCLLVSAGH